MNDNRRNHLDKVKEIIGKVIKRRDNNNISELPKIDDNTSLTDDLGFDSMELADLTVLIEDEFGVDIFEEDIVDSIGEVTDKLSKNDV